MKTNFFELLVTTSMVVMIGLNIHANPLDFTSCELVFTNAVNVFINEMQNGGFILKNQSFSSGGQVNNESGVIEILNDTNLFFVNNNIKSTSTIISYSTNEFLAAKSLTGLFLEVAAVGCLPPTNTTYQTDFTVLSWDNCGVATKHAFVFLISTNLVAKINTSSDDGDSSQDMIQVIKKVETMRDALNAEAQ